MLTHDWNYAEHDSQVYEYTITLDDEVNLTVPDCRKNSPVT